MNLATARRVTAIGAVGALAAAGLVPLATGALAGHVGAPDQITITYDNPRTTEPEAQDPVTDTRDRCVGFVVTARDGNGDPTPGVVIDVQVSDDDSNLQQDVDFCTLSGVGEEPKQTPDDKSTPPRPFTRNAQFTTDDAGRFVFGIAYGLNTDSSAAGGASVVAYRDADNNDVFDQIPSSEPNDTQDVDFVDDEPRGVYASPDSDTNLTGETHVFDVAVTDQARESDTSETERGHRVSGVRTVYLDLLSGPNDAAFGPPRNCPITDNAGHTTCSYTGTLEGTDQLVVYRSADDAVLEAGEARDEVSKTWIGPGDVSRVRVDLVCNPGGADQARTSDEDCVNHTSQRAETFTALVTADTNSDGTYTVGEVPAGTAVRFTENGPDATLSPTECTTGGPSPSSTATATATATPSPSATPAGSCSTVLTEATPTAGETVTVTATVVGQNPSGDTAGGQQTSDSGTKTWRNAPTDARRIELQPDGGQLTGGQSQGLTATVTDAAGKPVSGVQVTFTEDGPGSVAPTSGITDAAGQTSTTLTTPSDANALQQVTATITGYRSTDATGVEQGSTVNPRGGAADDDHCESAAGHVPNGQGTGANDTPDNDQPDSAPGAPEGRCSDTSTFGIGSVTPTPSPTPSTTASGSPSASPSGTTSPTRSSTPTSPPTVQHCQDVTAVSITVNVQRITSGNAPRLSGMATRSGGSSVANCGVTLLAKNYLQRSYEVVDSTGTDGEGRYVFDIRPERQTAYVARIGNAQSSSLVVFVSARVNLNRPVAGQVLPRSYCFTGDLDPNAPDFRGAAVGLARVGRDAAGRLTFAVIGQTVTRNDPGATFTVCPASRQLADGVYVIFTSARNGLLKGSVSQRVDTA